MFVKARPKPTSRQLPVDLPVLNHAANDHRRGDCRRPDRTRPRHDLRAAGRAERPSVRRVVQVLRSHPHRPHAPRTGRGLHGARCGARDRQAASLCGGAGARAAQFVRRAAHRLFDERAGAGTGRPDSRPRYRTQARAVARDQRSGWHHRAAGRSFGARAECRGRAAHGRRSIPRDVHRAARPGGTGMPDQCVG
ncbi:MAG: hypothetical protein QOF14_4730 [Hyphomicrobiales bacterium]|nr:hypothetical protein [Hyphomicrobiales bacterium]